MSEDIALKVQRLEVESEYTKKILDQHTESLKEIGDNVNDIRSRFDKQNGLLPHLKEGLDSLNVQVTSIRELFTSTEKDKNETKGKIKVIWAIAMAIVTGAITILFKVFH